MPYLNQLFPLYFSNKLLQISVMDNISSLFSHSRASNGSFHCWVKSGKEPCQQFITAQFMVYGDIGENGRQRADLQRIMGGNRDVMLSRLHRGKPDVTPDLSGNLAANRRQCLCQLDSSEVPGEFHTARTSS
jgi:hypothetical protein